MEFFVLGLWRKWSKALRVRNSSRRFDPCDDVIRRNIARPPVATDPEPVRGAIRQRP
jgi:hypothetical protein